MKLRIILGISLLTMGTFSHAGTLCQQKEQSIQNEISYADKHHNRHRVAGLQRALSEVRANCNDSDLIKARQEKIRQHQQKVAERQHELQQEQAAGDKLKKREKELAEASHQLKQLQTAPY